MVSAVVGVIALWAAASVCGSSEGQQGRPGRSVILNLEHPRVVVLKKQRRLHLFDGPALVRSYSVDLGSEPGGDKRCLADGRTPEGKFRICVKRHDSEHHRFLGISYPGVEAARKGLADGLLTSGETAAIVAAAKDGTCPPWTTPLGGGIGIHGFGSIGPVSTPDWTAGCIAVADDHIEELFAVLRIGDPVEVLP